MGEFEEVDLSKKYNIITNNEKFKVELSKWLFNKNYNYFGNVLSCVDDFDSDIVIYKEDTLDLQFNCRNKNGEELIILLFDDNNNTSDSKYLLVFKKGVDVEYFGVYNNKDVLSLTSGVAVTDDFYGESSSKPKEKVKIL